MGMYNYKARNVSGQLLQGTIEADNEKALASKLSTQGLMLIKSEELKKKTALKESMSRFKKVSLKSISIFARQFSTMIDAGVSLVKCLDVLSQQTEDEKLRGILREVRQSVEDGSTLANAFNKHKQVFGELFINLVHAGEVGGVLDEVMQRLAFFFESEQKIRSKVKSAMTYPAVILFIAVAVVIFLVAFVLPTFVTMFEGMDVTLPAPTRMLLWISASLRSYWYLFIVGAIIFVVSFSRFISTPTGKNLLDRFILKLPVFGMLIRKIAISRFSRTLSTLLSSGVPVLQALDVVARAAGNNVVAEAILKARASIREGESIATPLGETEIFPPMVTQMISVGEETGNLDTMLGKIADFYDLEIETTVGALTSLLEPLLMVAMGFIVGFIVISMFLPLFNLVGALGQGK